VSYDLVIRDARVDGASGDIAIAGERIVAIGAGFEAVETIEAGGRLVSPAFVQPHIHLDKVVTGPLLGPNRTGTLAEAIAISHRVKRAATVEQIRARAGAVIRAAVIAGTTAIRSHVDVDAIGGLKGLRGVAAARDDHADLCSIQLVAFPQEGIWRDPGTHDLMEEAMREGADLVVLDAETARDALREPAPRRWVLRGGRVVAETVREQRLHR
jgi:cytosine/creatinine deaminase